jgi:acyl-CoA thioester hydrolase
MTFRHEIQRRFGDADMYGHINNVRFFEYLEDTRATWQRGFPAELPKHYGHIVVHQEIDYAAMLLPSDLPLVVEMSVSRIGHKSYTQDYRVFDDDGTEAATAQAVMVIFDGVTGRAILIPEYMRDWMSKFAKSQDVQPLT